MQSGYQEAVAIINEMIYAGAPEPTTRIKGTVFDQYLTEQLQKRASCSFTNEEIKQRLTELNQVELDRQAQVREQEAGTRVIRSLGNKVNRMHDALAKELKVSMILYSTKKQRFEVIW